MVQLGTAATSPDLRGLRMSNEKNLEKAGVCQGQPTGTVVFGRRHRYPAMTQLEGSV